ncbi:hypothetical protein EYS09_22255 [Streptomyces kasugaensis]|uniref:DUF3307 domain-containing protein n=1 Tax=Streptomyces kasugaensis TaxID=1946 RepID=A0A4Q9HRE5_STRKA|nr:hypothetical protein [Streptomyces kasugaensis]TBO57536.1 hypothetical protein EYS09_22255 [Streptomyces kasugaensis]
MTIHQLATLATLGALGAVLSAGHALADHVLGQTDHQSARKAAPSREDVDRGVNPRRGWGACLAHVAQYHLVLGALIAIAWAVLPLQMTWVGLAAGLVVSASTHALLDRRWPVRWLLEHTGSPGFATLEKDGVSGPYLADQALHKTALLVAAALMVLL